MFRYFFFSLFFYILLIYQALAADFSGYIASELRVFPKSPLLEEQHDGADFSPSVKLRIYHEWDEGSQRITFIPFFRLDQHDPERTHYDIRELYWLKVADTWELGIGISKVFWGVTESQHLVDIINQTDIVERPDGEAKLGQPMIDLSLIRSWGTIDFYLLPYFRERTFPGKKGRLRTHIIIDTDHAEYESDAEKWHMDWAVRWFHSIGEFDIGLSHFSGTSREPRLIAQYGTSGELKLIPYYDIIDQSSLDLQWTHGGWLWKIEGINRYGQGDRFSSLTGGFEYTFVGIFDSAMDLGVLTEYLFDERGDDAPTPFEDDLFVGSRLVFNDVQSTEVLAGVIWDMDTNANFITIEASRRLGNSWRLNFEIRTFNDIPRSDPSWGLHKDDYMQLELVYYL